MNSSQGIVVREILYRQKGKEDVRKLVIKLIGPYPIDRKSVSFNFDEGTAGCKVIFEGLNDLDNEVFGVDKLHALTIAVDIDPIIRSKIGGYDFFWIDGEPYFDE